MSHKIPPEHRDSYYIGRIRGICVGYKCKAIPSKDAMKRILEILKERELEK